MFTKDKISEIIFKMKSVLYFSFILLLASCNVRSPKATNTETTPVANDESIVSDSSLTTNEIVYDDSVVNKDWRDTVLTISNKLIPLELPFSIEHFWGKLDGHSYDGSIFSEPMPHIKGLYHQSTMRACLKDTCYAKRAVIAVRCPHNPKLEKWFSKVLYTKVKNFLYGYKKNEMVPKPKKNKSPKYWCNQYIKFIRNYFKSLSCAHSSGGECIEQNGLLIMDVWRRKDYCTFLVDTWYDMCSCGNTTQKVYYSVDTKTGKQLELNDMLEVGDSTALSILLLKHLRNHSAMYVTIAFTPPTVNEGLRLLRQMDGCAMTRKGLLISFVPYNIGCGADGHFYAVIPYKELTKQGIRIKYRH